MTPPTARIAAAFVALAAAAFVGACGGSSTDEHAGHTSTTQSPEGAAHNADDVAFARNMIPHHQQAVEMATMVPTNTTNPDVIALAQQISNEQLPEIQAFNAMLVQWGEDPHDTGHGANGGMGMGMVDAATMDKLRSLNGPDFDKLWLQSMITHHQGAIDMAQQEIAHGQDPDVIGLARSIVAAQQAEIDKMKQLLGG